MHFHRDYTLPNGLVGVPYSAAIYTIGGTAPIYFSVTQEVFLQASFLLTGNRSDIGYPGWHTNHAWNLQLL